MSYILGFFIFFVLFNTKYELYLFNIGNITLCMFDVILLGYRLFGRWYYCFVFYQYLLLIDKKVFMVVNQMIWNFSNYIPSYDANL